MEISTSDILALGLVISGRCALFQGLSLTTFLPVARGAREHSLADRVTVTLGVTLTLGDQDVL
jgi:hypothetical protein